MKFFKVSLFLIILLILQSVFVPYIAIQGIAPDVLLIFLVYWTYRHGRLNGVILGFMAGFIQDLIGAGLAGMYALSKSIACYTAGSLLRNRYELNPLFLGIVLFLVTFIHHFVYRVVDCFNTSSGFFSSIFRYVIPASFYTTIMGFGIYYFINWMQQRFRRQ